MRRVESRDSLKHSGVSARNEAEHRFAGPGNEICPRQGTERAGDGSVARQDAIGWRGRLATGMGDRVCSVLESDWDG